MNRRSFLAEWRDAVRDSELTQNPKHVALTLTTYMNREGVAWPAKTTLAAATSMSKRSVDRAIGKLVLFGFLLVSTSNGRSSNRYQAVLPTVSQVQGSDTPNGVREDSQPCQKRHSTLSQVHPKAVESRKKAQNRPIDDCMKCGNRRPLLAQNNGVLYCDDCVEQAV